MSALTSIARSLPFVGSKGFTFSETMAGHHVLLEGDRAGERLQFKFDAVMTSDSLADFIFGGAGEKAVSRLEGTLNAEGLATNAPIRGTLEYHFGRQRGMLVYAFDFTGDDGRAYHFRGEKHREVPNITKGMTTLHGKVTAKQTCELISQGISYFDMKDLPEFLGSYKLV